MMGHARGNTIDDPDDDDDIIPLDEAPELFRKKPNNSSDPIIVPDSPEAIKPTARPVLDRQDPLSQLRGQLRDEAGSSRPSSKRARHVAFDSDDSDLDTPGPSKRVAEHKPTPAALSLGWVLSPDDLALPNAPLSDDVPQPGPSTVIAPPPAGDAKSLLPGVLEILPDLCPTWAIEKLEEELARDHLGNCVANVLAMALEVDGGYPIAQKSDVPKPAAIRPIDYKCNTFRQGERRGAKYTLQSISWLDSRFRMIPAQFIKNTYMRHPHLVTCYYALKEASAQQPTPYQHLRKARTRCVNKGKGKEEAQAPPPPSDDPFTLPGTSSADHGQGEFVREHAALLHLLDAEEKVVAAAKQKQQAIEDAIAAGSAVQCCICFADDIPTDMFHCPSDHPYCQECAQKHVDMHLEHNKFVIICGHQDGCSTPLAEREIERFLSKTSLKLYHRIRQETELNQAAIEGLESCPRCPFAMVIDNPDEKLFRCLNQDCGAITCRKCKRLEHIPKTCAEIEAERKLNKLHAVEDAMSEALFRRCPNAKCKKPYTKESGCNKMVCSSCGEISCYMCRQVITNGYQHFDQDPHEPGVPRKSNKCLLWDRELAQHDARAVIAARDAAQAEVRAAAAAEGMALDDSDINVHVDMPVPAQAPAQRDAPAPAPAPAQARPARGPQLNVAGVGAADLPHFNDLVPPDLMAFQRHFQALDWRGMLALPGAPVPALDGAADLEAHAQALQNAARNALMGHARPAAPVAPRPPPAGRLQPNAPNPLDMMAALQLRPRPNQPNLLQEAQQQQADIAGALGRMRQALGEMAPRAQLPGPNHRRQPVPVQPDDRRHVRFDVAPPAPPDPEAARRREAAQQLVHQRNEQMAGLRQARRLSRRERADREQQLGAAAALT